MLSTLQKYLLIGLATLLLLSGGLNAIQFFRNGALSASLTAANNNLNTEKKNAKASSDSAANWQQTAKDLQAANDELTKQKATLEQANAKALAGAEAKERDAKAALSLWQARYVKAQNNPTCAAILNTPLSVCQELTQ